MMKPEVISHQNSRVTLYRNAPSWEEQKTAAVGGIKFSSVAEGSELLSLVANQCLEEGFGALLGPLDGDTWHSYRLILETDRTSPFLMEPTSEEHDLATFRQSGFQPVSKYISTKAKLKNTLGESPVEVSGVTVQSWDGENGNELIRNLFDMSTLSFAGNKFFTPITFEDFMAIYQPLLPLIQKEHVLFARDTDNTLVGFLFGSRDFMDQSEKPSVILKTYASRVKGVGHLLVDTYHRSALEMGFETVIHALMQEDNLSRARSEMHNAEIFRQYALMGKKL